MVRKLTHLTLALCFSLTILGPIPNAHGDSLLGLPTPGSMVNLSPAYQPVIIRGLTVHKDNPFLFDFIVDAGQDKMAGDSLKKEGEKLIKYFLASLAIPDKDVWVNLSPYEKTRMIPEALGQTDMGRDLLEQDYILKQITASLIYPEKQLGRKFWDTVYSKAQAAYGSTQIPVNTFNKVWIMADRAEVFERNQTAFVVGSHLKVMLEEDYLALRKHSTPRNETHSISSQVVRQIILPELEKEVNTGKNFANLRQIFNSIILSSWYKKNLQQALLNQVYADKSKVKGINLDDPSIKQQIYEQYLKAYKKGVFNYIKEDINKASGETLPKKYFSGGIHEARAADPLRTSDPGQLADAAQGYGRLEKFETQITMSDAAMAAEIKPYEDIDSMYKKLPGDIVHLMAGIAEHNGFTDSFTPLDQEDILKLITKIGEIYAKMKLATQNYHNHLHNMDITYGSLLLAENAGLIKDKEDLISVFLAGLFHDFHVRKVRPNGRKEKATTAFVDETLGDPDTHKGGQLPDLLGINHFIYEAPATAGANFQQIITVKDKEEIQSIVRALTNGLDREKISAEMTAQIRRTDFLPPVSDIYKNKTQRIRDMMDRQAHIWTNDKSNLENLIMRVRKEYAKIQDDIRALPTANAEERMIPFYWVSGQEEIDLNFLNELKNISPQRRGIVYQMANRLELADQSVMFWIGSSKVSDSITEGLKEELPVASKEGNKPMFLDYQLLIDRVLSRLKELPLNFRINFFNNVEYYVNFTKKFVADLKIEEANKMPRSVLLRMQEDWNNWKRVDEERVLMGLGLYKDRDGQVKAQEVNFETMQALRHSIVGRAFSLTDIYYMVLNHMVTKIKVNPNALIIRQGDVSGTEMYIIVSGNVVLTRDGHDFPNNILRPGPYGHFGELTDISELPRNATVNAGKSGAVVLQIKSELIDGLRFNNPGFNLALFEQIPGRLRPDLQPHLPDWAKPNIVITVSRPDHLSSWELPVAVHGQGIIGDLTPENVQTILSDVLKDIEGQYPQRMGRIKNITIVSADKTPAHLYLNPIDRTEVIVLSKDLLKKGHEKIITALRKVFDSAMVSTKPWHQGGIDLNTSSGMRWKINKDGKGVEMNIDPAMIEQIKQQGIESLSAYVLKITPVVSIWPLVGFSACPVSK